MNLKSSDLSTKTKNNIKVDWDNNINDIFNDICNTNMGILFTSALLIKDKNSDIMILELSVKNKSDFDKLPNEIKLILDDGEYTVPIKKRKGSYGTLC